MAPQRSSRAGHPGGEGVLPVRPPAVGTSLMSSTGGPIRLRAFPLAPTARRSPTRKRPSGKLSVGRTLTGGGCVSASCATSVRSRPPDAFWSPTWLPAFLWAGALTPGAGIGMSPKFLTTRNTAPGAMLWVEAFLTFSSLVMDFRGLRSEPRSPSCQTSCDGRMRYERHPAPLEWLAPRSLRRLLMAG